jgi:hypothetical protein
MLPGVLPGKNTPIVTDFLDDISKLKKYDQFDTLTKEKTMTEKVTKLSAKYVLHVQPISFFSKSFSDSQVKSYATMEKEMLGLCLLFKIIRITCRLHL